MRKYLLIPFALFSLSVSAQMAVYDAAAVEQAEKNHTLSLAKYTQIAEDTATLLNTATATLDKLANMDKMLLTMNANLKCAFDQTTAMIHAADGLEKKLKDMGDGKIFMTTQALINKVKVGDRNFAGAYDFVNFVAGSYASPDMDARKQAQINKAIDVLEANIRLRRLKLMQEYLDNEAQRLAFVASRATGQIADAEESNGTQTGTTTGSGKPVGVCLAQQNFNAQRVMLAQYEILQYQADLMSLTELEKTLAALKRPMFVSRQ